MRSERTSHSSPLPKQTFTSEWGAVIAKLCQTVRFLDRPSKDKGLKIVRCR